MRVMAEDKTVAAAPARSSRGKYITLVVLLVWVAAVFVFTLFKFSGNAS